TAGMGRRSQRRALHRWREMEETNRTLAALNSMYSAPAKQGHATSFFRTSAAQARAIDFIRQSVHEMGRPPADLSGPEALRQLRAAGAYDGGDQAVVGVPSPYNPESVSLPSPGWQPIDLAALWGADGHEMVGDFTRSKLLPLSDARQHVLASGVEKPYWDPCLKHKPTYGKFLSRLWASNLIDFVLEPCREEVAIFFVTKKAGRLRMIIDARRSNCHFTDPEYVHLCTGEALSRLEADAPLTVATADLKDAFYHIGLPVEWRDVFGLPPIQAGLVDGLQASGLRDEARLRDRRPVPEKNILHTQYVDNLIVLGTDREAVLEAYQAAVFKFKEAGLQVHGEEVSDTGAKVLGWEIRADGHFGPSLHRAWKVRLAIRELLRRGRATGKQLERLLGHCVFISLGRRESLSVFSDIYRHVQRYRDCHVELPIPRGVRQELIKWDGILPLLRRSLRSKWSDTIHAVDASEWGLGVTDANLAQAQVRKLGQFNERWRFKEPGVARPRDHALVAAGGGSPDETSEHYQVDRDFQAFEPVAFGIVDRPWRTTACYRWKRKLSLPVAEDAFFPLSPSGCSTGCTRLRVNMIHRGMLTTPLLSAAAGAQKVKGHKRRMAPPAATATQRGDGIPNLQPAIRTRRMVQRKKRKRQRAAEGERTALEDAAVTPACHRRYTLAWEPVRHLVYRSRSTLRSFSVIDKNLAEKLQDMYMDGEDLSAGQYLIAAVLFFSPQVKAEGMQKLPRVKQSLQGWRRLAPPQSRLPIPFEAVALLAKWGFENGPASEMPRSGETSNQSEALPAVDTGPPSTGAGHSSKTMEFDETLELDLPYHDNVGEALARVAAVGSRDPEEVLFKHSLRDLARFLERGAEALHLQALGPLHPYRLRHGGASHDFSLGLRDLPAIQLRGRWRSAASVRRYQKGGRLAQLFAGLPGEVQRAALKAVSDLSHLCAVVR
ncbi:unnamed protein product, partial [Symbiodinium pilosum]